MSIDSEPPPSYSDVVAIKQAFAHLDRARGGYSFPERFSIWPNSHDSAVKWLLGESTRHRPLYAISRREQRSGNKPDVILHNGISLKDHSLASFRSFQPKTWSVRLPSHAEPNASLIVSAPSDWRAQKRPLLRFSIETDVHNRLEEFEWRSSNNENIRASLGGDSLGLLGWKLVRIVQDDLTRQIPGPRGAWPRTKNGAEIVAVFTNSETALSEWRFAFLGTATTAALGSNWQLMAISTALILLDTALRVERKAA
ncbi:hypothetical protein PFICI_12918 [Pestalotiopsis fici W106-1]|uniref:Uncharacterized protein n=1 Tax=Pestalotiopsis fici (strain W106-1 / CGMCC3.15140) TaxID=1229662 RepID=W3WQ90_PESFW|nr:uncharacterized protein PFICI_12918 [Pestalotiopsis fici W106-1]ETS75974.1 hypothetical protein PFICI_12918 [Pestalotiopsis fici W106-1]